MISIHIAQKHYQELLTHLHPGDGKEAVAFGLCGQLFGTERTKLLIHKLVVIPYEHCIERAPDRVQWRSTLLPALFAEARENNWSIIKFHSHPANCMEFSDYDDESDQLLFPRIYNWLDSDQPHASVIVTPNGDMCGRIVDSQGNFQPIDAIWLAGHDIRQLSNSPVNEDRAIPQFSKRITQTFGDKTFQLLQNLNIGVIGCSGTGGPVIEQLVRNGVGSLLLVDPDVVDYGNLNRIPYSTLEDAQNSIPKVALFKRAIKNIGLGTKVDAVQSDIFDRDVIKKLADCDILIGCMDTVDGRHLLNKLATFYLIPYFDLGVKLVADGQGGVDDVCGQYHYLIPGESSLLSRGVYDAGALHASSLYRTDPAAYQEFKKDGYIQGVNTNRPAVVSINTMTSSLAVLDLLARLHPYRKFLNSELEFCRVSLPNMLMLPSRKRSDSCSALARYIGLGDVEPMLYNPELSEQEEQVA